MSTTKDIHNRIRIIADELEKGKSSAQITAFYSPQWKVTERTLRKYFAYASDILDEREKDIDTKLEAQRAAIIEEKSELMRSNFELEMMLMEILDSGMEVERITAGPKGETVVKSKVRVGEKRRIIELIMKKRGLFRKSKEKEDKDRIMAPVIVVKSEEQKALIDRIAALP